MLSILIPFHNERENLPLLLDSLKNQLHEMKEDYEFIFIDDGSTDMSSEAILHEVNNENIILVRHGKRLGKGKALNSGLKRSTGDLIVFMDADLQDDPADLPKFLAKIHEGYDLVNGNRKGHRRDNFIIKMYSSLANAFLSKFLQSPFSDINSGFKMFKRKVTEDIVLYANNFRFLPLAAYYRGFRVTEIEVHNKQRIHGKSKFGMRKIFIGLFDTLTAYFLYQFSERPLHFFGIIGGFFFILGLLFGLYLTVERLFFGVLLYRRPSLLLAILLIIVGLQIVMTGMLGELIVYINKKKS